MVMQTWLLPEWLRTTWIVVLVVIAVLHLGHARGMGGQRRYWHLGHVLMAVGMAEMYAPFSPPLLPGVVGMALFALAVGAAAAAAVWLRRREGAWPVLWVLSSAEMAAMAYMFLPMSAHSALLSYVLAAYLLGQSLLWAFGTWDRYLLPGRTAIDPVDRRSVAADRAAVPVRRSSPALRFSLVAMSACMAHMLLAI